jgi:hypothetical protein
MNISRIKNFKFLIFDVFQIFLTQGPSLRRQLYMQYDIVWFTYIGVSS